MAITGNLSDMSIATLVQSLRQENTQTLLKVRQQDMLAQLFLDSGHLRHATMHHVNGTLIKQGEEVFYDILGWETGKFVVERGIAPPARDIDKSWDFLLMEGLRHFDEKKAATTIESPDITDLFSGLSEEDTAELQTLLTLTEEQEMASKSEQVQAVLSRVVNESGDLVGAVVVSNDGLVMGSVLSSSIDSNRVGAVSAGLISLAGRSAQQLNQGALRQTLIQAENGNIIAIRAGKNASFVGLAGPNVNLGMVFLECGDAASEISNIL